MATKWKSFNTNRFVKAAAIVLFVICFGAMGVIAGYLPAFSYVKSSEPYGGFGGDSLLADSFLDSLYFAYEYKCAYDEAYEVIERNFKSDNAELFEELEQLPFYASISINGIVGSNTHSPFYVIRMGAGSKILTENVPDIMSTQNFKAHYLQKTSDFIEIGFTREQYDGMKSYWLEMRRNMQIVLISEIALFVVGMALLVFICIGAGRKSDGTVTYPRIFRVFYEIPLLLFMAGLVPVVFMVGGDNRLVDLCRTSNGRVLYMLISGALTALTFAFLLHFSASVAVRRKNKCAPRGSVLYLLWLVLKKVFIFVGRCCVAFGRQLLRFFRCVKELFTGELYTSDTAAKKLMLMDIAMLVVSFILLPIIGIAINDRAGVVFIVCGIIELLLLALFFYGRYLVLRDGAVLEEQIKKMHDGDYSKSERTLAKNSPYAKSYERLSEMSAQYRRGIEESVKAERMKMELVTNVSHDLKTPLTSIIGYIDLLSKEELDGDAAEYVEILRMKSERLKNIVSDVFELAKTTSGEIAVEREPLDLTKLSYQTLGEMEDKIAASELEVKVSICEPPVTVVSDGKRLYRVIQNLLDNALKYSLKGTRIYYSLEKRDGNAVITIKNIASYEMTFTKDEILERFTRGDKARSTEGTGLGLSIAQGFALACGGQFDIDIDGDMFKAIVTFPMVNVDTEEKTAVTADE